MSRLPAPACAPSCTCGCDRELCHLSLGTALARRRDAGGVFPIVWFGYLPYITASLFRPIACIARHRRLRRRGGLGRDDAFRPADHLFWVRPLCPDGQMRYVLPLGFGASRRRKLDWGNGSRQQHTTRYGSAPAAGARQWRAPGWGHGAATLRPGKHRVPCRRRAKTGRLECWARPAQRRETFSEIQYSPAAQRDKEGRLSRSAEYSLAEGEHGSGSGEARKGGSCAHRCPGEQNRCSGEPRRRGSKPAPPKAAVGCPAASAYRGQ